MRAREGEGGRGRGDGERGKERGKERESRRGRGRRGVGGYLDRMTSTSSAPSLAENCVGRLAGCSGRLVMERELLDRCRRWALGEPLGESPEGERREREKGGEG